MGLIIGPSFTTDFGVSLNGLYLSLATTRIINLKDADVQATFTFDAYASREAKYAGATTIPLPYGQNVSEIVMPANDLINNFYTIAYTSIYQKYSSYSASNIFEPGQVNLLDYRFNSDGYDMSGYNVDGYNAQGFNAQGYNAEGYNAQGFNAQGYNAEGYNAQGFNAEGYNAQGLDAQGNPRPS